MPTKITGLSAKLRLLGEAVFVATGGYTPYRAAPRIGGWLWPGLVTLALLIPLFLSAVVAPRSSPDSWALHELG